MSEVEVKEFGNLYKIALCVKVRGTTAYWYITVNDNLVAGNINVNLIAMPLDKMRIAYYAAVNTVRTILMGNGWDYCERCGDLFPFLSEHTVFYDDEGTERSSSDNLCPDCVTAYKESGAIKEER